MINQKLMHPIKPYIKIIFLIIYKKNSKVIKNLKIKIQKFKLILLSKVNILLKIVISQLSKKDLIKLISI